MCCLSGAMSLTWVSFRRGLHRPNLQVARDDVNLPGAYASLRPLPPRPVPIARGRSRGSWGGGGKGDGKRLQQWLES